ncbi:MAG: hypothetical protein ABIS36_23970 [Chryseolinea sp.]
MKTIKGIAFVVLIFAFSCDTERNVAPVFEAFFTKYYGADGNQSAVDLLVNPDGTMVMLGNTTSQISSIPRPYIVKVDNMGIVLWQKQLGVQNEAASDIDSDGNGGILVVSNVLASGTSQIKVLHLDPNGGKLDSVVIDNKRTTSGNSPVAISQSGISINAVSDGSLLLVGTAGPNFIIEGPTLTDGPDQADLLAFRFVSGIHNDKQPEQLVKQGGEHVGQIVKGFQASIPGSTSYVFFGDSDRPFDIDGRYKRAFEIFATDEFGGQMGPRPSTGIVAGETQVASTAIETPGLSQDSYLLIGTSTIGGSSTMFIIQYVINSLPDGIVVRINKHYDFGPRMEGTTAAMSPTGEMYLLGNIIQDNNKRDVILVKADGEGNNESYKTFGALEGDDVAAGVSVLPDGRIAVVATIELETQKKIALFILSPDGTFTNN